MTAVPITEKGWGHHEQHSTYRAERPDRGYARQPQRARSGRDREHIGQSCQPDSKKSRVARTLGQRKRERKAQDARAGNGYSAGCGRNYRPAETAAAKGLQATARPRRGLRQLPRHLLRLPGLLLLGLGEGRRGERVPAVQVAATGRLPAGKG